MLIKLSLLKNIIANLSIYIVHSLFILLINNGLAAGPTRIFVASSLLSLVSFVVGSAS